MTHAEMCTPLVNNMDIALSMRDYHLSAGDEANILALGAKSGEKDCWKSVTRLAVTGVAAVLFGSVIRYKAIAYPLMAVGCIPLIVGAVRVLEAPDVHALKRLSQENYDAAQKWSEVSGHAKSVIDAVDRGRVFNRSKMCEEYDRSTMHMLRAIKSSAFGNGYMIRNRFTPSNWFRLSHYVNNPEYFEREVERSHPYEDPNKTV